MPEGRLLVGSRRHSSWSLRGWLAVRLAGLDVSEEVIRLSGGATPEVKARTPAGLVPFLEHRGIAVWESLAICEYCAELFPALWPADHAARAHARSIAAEMHAGFAALRQSMPMHLDRHHPGRGRTPGALADIARIETLWQETQRRFGGAGPYLFGALFTAADAMYAPVATRFLTYEPEISPASRAYCEAVRAHPLVARWYEEAAREPEEWRIAKHEADLA
ncbi:MAG: glutathione S-transferase [Rhodospirillales bacterium]|nr:glutathione S-transferase [Rhodospirillales bacterium]